MPVTVHLTPAATVQTSVVVVRTVAPTDPDRIFAVGSEYRTLAVAPESRAFPVAHESRTFAVDVEDT